VFGYFKKFKTALKMKKSLREEKEKQKVNSFEHLYSKIEKNLDVIKKTLGDSSDIIMKEFTFGFDGKTKGALICVDGLVNMDLLSASVLKPFIYDSSYRFKVDKLMSIDLGGIERNLISTGEVDKIDTFGKLFEDVLSGNSILLVDGAKEALTIGARQWEKRGVSEPAGENVVRGPRQGFTETLRVNTSMLRRILKNTNLRFVSMKIGKQTKTDIVIAYIQGIVKDELIEDIKKRMENINTDSVLDSGYIEAFIEDAPFSIFPTIGNSEKPDTVAGKMLEGRAAILVDGSPFVLTAPMVFMESFQTAEDYYIRSTFATSLRVIRLFSYMLTILAPALYVALTTFHQELIPTSLLFTMTAGVSGVPFPAVVEALVMMITFDILKEAGVRLPKPVGSAISIVGALVIGQSAVQAGIVGPFMVIIVAITAITSFVTPFLIDSSTLLRYFLLMLAGIGGGFGILLGLLAILVYLAALQSFGMPYLAPLSPFNREAMKDMLVRMPLKTMLMRPFKMAGNNRKRRGDAQPPKL
jgi:spore germination protein KA